MKKGQAVKPLKKNDIENIFKLLEKNENIVMLGVIKFALNTGLRISDILLLKFENMESTFLTEKKTKKTKGIIYNSSCKDITKRLTEYYKKNIIIILIVDICLNLLLIPINQLVIKE